MFVTDIQVKNRDALDGPLGALWLFALILKENLRFSFLLKNFHSKSKEFQ